MYIDKFKKIVIKIGSSILINKKGKLKKIWLNEFAKDIQILLKKKKQIDKNFPAKNVDQTFCRKKVFDQIYRQNFDGETFVQKFFADIFAADNILTKNFGKKKFTRNSAQ